MIVDAIDPDFGGGKLGKGIGHGIIFETMLEVKMIGEIFDGKIDGFEALGGECGGRLNEKSGHVFIDAGGPVVPDPEAHGEENEPGKNQG